MLRLQPARRRKRSRRFSQVIAIRTVLLWKRWRWWRRLSILMLRATIGGEVFWHLVYAVALGQEAIKRARNSFGFPSSNLETCSITSTVSKLPLWKDNMHSRNC